MAARCTAPRACAKNITYRTHKPRTHTFTHAHSCARAHTRPEQQLESQLYALAALSQAWPSSACSPGREYCNFLQSSLCPPFEVLSLDHRSSKIKSPPARKIKFSKRRRGGGERERTERERKRKRERESPLPRCYPSLPPSLSKGIAVTRD